MGAAMLAIDHPGGAFTVVALGELPNPVARVARAFGNHWRRLAPCQQPEDLPPTALVRLAGLPIALFQFVNAQVRSKMNTSHAPDSTILTTELLSQIPHALQVAIALRTPTRVAGLPYWYHSCIEVGRCLSRALALI